MRLLYGFTFLCLLHSTGWAQTPRLPLFYTTIPYDLQLFARDSTNQAPVVVAGYVNSSGYRRIRLFLFRENKLLSIAEKQLNVSDTLTEFRLASLIRAERAQYSVKLFLYRSATDSVLALERQRLVCGDVLLVHGQSNAAGSAGLDQFSAGIDDTYLRNCTYPFGATDIPNQIIWYPAKLPYANIGILGLSLQKLILDTYGIPTAVFNGAVGGGNIRELTRRTSTNPADVNTIYGRLLIRLRWAGLAGQVRAVIWRQGENEAGGDDVQAAGNYPAEFARFYQQLRQDFGPRFRLFVGQINLLPAGNNKSGFLRDFQRQTPRLFPRTTAMSTVGSPGYDGVHYSLAGYSQQASELFRQIARDVYGSRDTLEIDAPGVQKVFKNAGRDTLTLVFAPDQQLRWPADLTLTSSRTGRTFQRRLVDVFYLDGRAGLVRGGTATANRVTLALNSPSSATALTYLPPWFSDANSEFYDGPHLTNGRGLRAFSFDGVAIAEGLPAPTALAISSLTRERVRLGWTLPVGAGTLESLWLERAVGDSAFVGRAVLPPTAVSYEDNTPSDRRAPYRYRLRAIGPLSESAPGNVVVAAPIVTVLSLPNPAAELRLYPNPVVAGGTLTISTGTGQTVLEIRLLDALGRTVFVDSGPGPTWSLPAMATGKYLAEVTLANRQPLRQSILIR